MFKRTAFTLLPVLLAVASCATEPAVVQVNLSRSQVTLDALTAAVRVTAQLLDEKNEPVPTATASWSSDNPSIATVDATGLITAVGNGTTKVRASVGAASEEVNVTVLQVAKSLTGTGSDQSGEVGTVLPEPFAVVVKDGRDQVMVGFDVEFTVVSGNGLLGGSMVTTDAEGRAGTPLTLGTTAGFQSVSARIDGEIAWFNATALAAEPDSMVAATGHGQSGMPDFPLADSLRVRVTDRFGNPIPNITVTWIVASGDGTVSPTESVTGSNGRAATLWTLGPGFGPQEVQATADVPQSPRSFEATAVPPQFSVADGDGQVGLVGFGTNIRPTIRIAGGDTPLPGATVTFAVEGGSGSLDGAVQITDEDGYARPDKWILGDAPGLNTLSATVSDPDISPTSVSFEAMGVTSQYNIDLRYLTDMNESYQQVFEDAQARWQQLVIGDLPSVHLNAAAGTCGSNSPAIDEEVDDLLILVTVDSIDGPGGILGQAGPCYVRSTSGLPIMGLMRFDSADVGMLFSDGRLSDVILHEMAHVMGMTGTRWTTLGLLQNPAPPTSNDTHFSGARAREAFDEIGGDSYTGAKVPVENCDGRPNCGGGTWNSHWRESVFGPELMTGFISGPGVPNPLSRVSVASFWDMGYVVNLDGADQFTHTFFLHADAALRSRMERWELPWDGPVYVVDRSGRVVRVLQPIH